MPAGHPRIKFVAQAAKKVSRLATRRRFNRLRGRIKRSSLIRNSLYQPYTTANKPTMAEHTRRRLKEEFREEVVALDKLLGANFQSLWEYD